MLAQLYSLLAFGTLVLAAYGIGRPILRGLAVQQDDHLSVATWSIALGLVAAGMGLAVLGVAGMLYTSAIVLLTFVAALAGVREILRARTTLWEDQAVPAELPTDEAPEAADEVAWAVPAVWLQNGLLLAVLAACVGSFVTALAPPIAGDALCYHLELPKTFLAEQRLAYLPYHDNSTFPLLAEMWYLWALALDGGVAAQLVHWGLGLLLTLAAVVLAEPVLGRPWAWVVGAAVLLTPGVNNEMTAPLNDVALAAFTTLALAAWWRAAVTDEGPHWFVIAGLMGGAALGIKYLALVFAVAVGAAWCWTLLRHPARRRSLVEGAAIAAVVAVSVAGLWYVRAAWYRGNPVYPFFNEFSQRKAASDGPTATLPPNKAPLGHNPLGLATAAWHVTMQPERFGGRAHQLGILPLIAVPGIFFCRRLRGLGMLLAVGLAYATLWYLLRQNVRFLLPVVPILGAAIVWVWIEMRRLPGWPRAITGAVFAAVVAAMALVPLNRARGHWAVALGRESRDDYLIRHEPTYPAAVVANELLPADAHLLSQDHRAFYFNRRVTRENVYRRATHYDARIDDPATLANHLRAAGFTHLLLVEAAGGKDVPLDGTLARLADKGTSRGDEGPMMTLTEYQYHDADGAVRRYRLVALK